MVQAYFSPILQTLEQNVLSNCLVLLPAATVDLRETSVEKISSIHAFQLVFLLTIFIMHDM